MLIGAHLLGMKPLKNNGKYYFVITDPLITNLSNAPIFKKPYLDLNLKLGNTLVTSLLNLNPCIL